jgi:predicted kinase
MSKLIIVRGLPGSGKSTLAKKLVDSGEADVFFEADMWMVDKNNSYKFDPLNLKHCHDECLKSTCSAIIAGKTVIVSNTFSTIWEMENYINFAKENNAEVVIYRLINNYGSIHNVPEYSMVRMALRFENIDGEIIIE